MVDEALKAVEPPYNFDRYVNGQLMAEGVRINEAASLEDAVGKAVRLCPDTPGTVLVARLALPAPAPVDEAGVTQADRDAAAQYLLDRGIATLSSAFDMRDGDWDNTDHVQAFARHRLASLRASPAPATGEDQRRADRLCNLEMGLEEIRDAYWPGDDAVARIQKSAARYLDGSEEDLDARMRADLSPAPHPEPTVDVLLLSNRVQQLMERDKLTYREAEKLSGVDKSVLQRLVSSAKPMTLQNYMRLQRWVNQLAPAKAPADVEERAISLLAEQYLLYGCTDNAEGLHETGPHGPTEKAALAAIKRALTGNDEGGAR